MIAAPPSGNVTAKFRFLSASSTTGPSPDPLDGGPGTLEGMHSSLSKPETEVHDASAWTTDATPSSAPPPAIQRAIALRPTSRFARARGPTPMRMLAHRTITH